MLTEAGFFTGWSRFGYDMDKLLKKITGCFLASCDAQKKFVGVLLVIHSSDRSEISRGRAADFSR